jgi:hypothetical protein
MDQFEYVMVLVSIIVGLGITHILLGISGILDRVSRKHDPIELSLAHASWLGFCFAWLVMFWWWEFRFFSTVSDWTMGLYLFLIGYAVTLFLLQAVLVPRTWDGVVSLKTYFLERRAWFYGLLLCATMVDMFDSYLKGGFEYILELGLINSAFAAVTLPVVVIGVMTTNIRFHNVMGVIFLGWQLGIAFINLNTLAS